MVMTLGSAHFSLVPNLCMIVTEWKEPGYKATGVHIKSTVVFQPTFSDSRVGMGNISILSYIVILRAHDNCIVVVLQLSSYRLHIISGAFA